MLELIETLHWGAVFQIILIDILLGSDNAIVIALACRNLPHGQRIRGILWRTAGASLLRVLLVALALALLSMPCLKSVGCALLSWIGSKLLAQEKGAHGVIDGGTSVFGASRTSIIADFAMSLDNVIAIAGAAESAHLGHQLYYVIFGLCVSVPVIVWGSTLVLKLIDRFPAIVTLGAGMLGWIAGGMLISDTFVLEHVGEPGPMAGLAVQIVAALSVIAVGKWLVMHRRHQPSIG